MTVIDKIYETSGRLIAKHLYLDASAGNDDDWDTAQAFLTPSLGKKLAITKLVIGNYGAGANYGISIGVFNYGSALASPDLTLFDSILQNADYRPFEMDFSNCPIMLEKDQFVLATMPTTGAYFGMIAGEALELDA